VGASHGERALGYPAPHAAGGSGWCFGQPGPS
jgi:hypothetical protein